MADLALGIDIGGTFTDIVLYDDSKGRHFVVKEPTTPTEPSRGVTSGIKKLLATYDIQAGEISRVIHATTLFTNALIERKGAVTGYLTTRGFGDVLEIGRERKYELYDLFLEMPRPLVPRNLRFEVDERIGANGEVLTALRKEEVLKAIRSMKQAGVESVAVTFLHSYINPENEQYAGELIATHFPEMYVTTSHDVVREINEYERASTSVANAYIKPLAHNYLDRMVENLRNLGIGANLFLMLSSGGLTNVEDAKRYPIRLLESGPAAGALAGSFFGRLNNENRILAFDMGGTTAKACIIDEAEPAIAYTFEAAREKRFMEGSGLPLKFTTVELMEIGAGGGSKAQIDALGLLKVGPESAGSEPGPVCYGRGGEVPTVTDADLLLGYLNPDFFLGGDMEIDKDMAEQAFQPLANQASLTLQELAWGIYDVVNEKMASAARVHIAEKGKDPREYCLLATGGAGPVHAYYVAKKLGLRQLICPPSAGVGSAIGLLMAPARVDYVQTFTSSLEALDWGAFEEAFRALENDAIGIIKDTQALTDQLVSRRRADMRFSGQGFELVVDLPEGPYDSARKQEIVDVFMKTYRALYSRIPEEVNIEIINIRLELQAPISRQTINFTETNSSDNEQAVKGHRQVYFPETNGYTLTPVLTRGQIALGKIFEGPAIIEERESTLVVGPGAKFYRQPAGQLVVDIA